LHDDWLARTDQAFDRSKEEFAKHFKTTYGGYPPIWIACEVWDFGALSFLFSGLKKSDQTIIANKYGIASFQVMESWIRNLNSARNICAHHCRLWNRPIGIQPRWPSAAGTPDLGHLVGNVNSQTRVYGTAAIIRFLLRSINPTTAWSERLKELCSKFPASPIIKLESAGFPRGWESEALWA
jgi:abortive infection bacteriophage resistance protein